MPKLMKIKAFAEQYFAKGNAPTLSTIRGLIDRGELAGQRIGERYYVDVSKMNKTGNKLVDQVLSA